MHGNQMKRGLYGITEIKQTILDNSKIGCQNTLIALCW